MTASTGSTEPSTSSADAIGATVGGDAAGAQFRLFAWVIVALTGAFLLNNYLIFWREFAPLRSLSEGSADPTAYAVAAVYVVAIGLAFAASYARYDRTLRQDSATLHKINLFIIRSVFWAVVLIGVADATISFLRVEGFLPVSAAWVAERLNPLFSAVGAPLYDGTAEGLTAFGDDMARDLGRSQFRGPYVHMPLVAAGVAIAAVTRTLGFQWLALLVVVAELFIVLGRFVFSYEQTFMSDLVRFWYAGLFLFASAYTLYEDGHVRVDIAYAGFSDVGKGWVNAFGSVALGLPLCAAILLIGLSDKTSVVNASFLNYETSQSGFGMYIKYLMAVFIAVFASTMLIQFMSLFLESVADIRREPGKREIAGGGGH